MVKISRKWFGEEEGCPGGDGTVITSESLTPDSFKGLFLIAGLSSSSALAIFLSMFLYENRVILASDTSIKRKLVGLARVFYRPKIVASLKESRTPVGTVSAQSPAISISYEHEGMFSQDEGFSTTEPGTPIHEPT